MTWAGQMAQSRTGQNKSPKAGHPAQGRISGNSEIQILVQVKTPMSFNFELYFYLSPTIKKCYILTSFKMQALYINIVQLCEFIE